MPRKPSIQHPPKKGRPIRTFLRSLKGVRNLEKELGITPGKRAINLFKRNTRYHELERILMRRNQTKKAFDLAYSHVRLRLRQKKVPRFEFVENKEKKSHPAFDVYVAATFQTLVNQTMRSNKDIVSQNSQFYSPYGTSRKPSGLTRIYYNQATRKYQIVIMWASARAMKPFEGDIAPQHMKNLQVSSNGRVALSISGRLTPKEVHEFQRVERMAAHGKRQLEAYERNR